MLVFVYVDIELGEPKFVGQILLEYVQVLNHSHERGAWVPDMNVRRGCGADEPMSWVRYLDLNSTIYFEHILSSP